MHRSDVGGKRFVPRRRCFPQREQEKRPTAFRAQRKHFPSPTRTSQESAPAHRPMSRRVAPPKRPVRPSGKKRIARPLCVDETPLFANRKGRGQGTNAHSASAGNVISPKPEPLPTPPALAFRPFSFTAGRLTSDCGMVPLLREPCNDAPPQNTQQHTTAGFSGRVGKRRAPPGTRDPYASSLKDVLSYSALGGGGEQSGSRIDSEQSSGHLATFRHGERTTRQTDRPLILSTPEEQSTDARMAYKDREQARISAEQSMEVAALPRPCGDEEE